MTEPEARLTAYLTGTVQGVGMRWWIRARALELGLSGFAANLADRKVQVVAEGPRDRCEALLGMLRADAGPGRILSVVEEWGTAGGAYDTFRER